MPYIIPHPSVQGFQEGAQENIQNMRTYENLLTQFQNNQALQARQFQDQAFRAGMAEAMLRNRLNPMTGQPMPNNVQPQPKYFNTLQDPYRMWVTERRMADVVPAPSPSNPGWAVKGIGTPNPSIPGLFDWRNVYDAMMQLPPFGP